MPAQLAVDLLHCERAAKQAVAESNGQLRIVQGELITAEYFDNLAAEIDEILQVSSCNLELAPADQVALLHTSVDCST